ncbi:Druantia anti-phage system protein DruA [Haloferula sp. BvORR071]|uniref:Druantia anti-phage system protein DruA n=1 Tax=Haloferula sp. BvORR071 TaxID=1396141 RepID=UPI000553F734|nr:Druantia anti-phage system protein DruA [Haloferula sp. BvORR071]
MKLPPLVPALEQGSNIKRALRRHLKSLGFTRDPTGQLVLVDGSKDGFRNCHAAQRAQKLKENWEFIQRTWAQHRFHFASGEEIAPEAISPRLEMVNAGTWQSELFRLATLTWSVPVSSGYGRRMRFLVWDKQNSKLIGLIGLTDPVFNLRARDADIGWNGETRRSMLACMMDAHILGALPPYNRLLGGKLVSCLIKSRFVRDAFRKKYASAVGVISGEAKDARLVAVTTSSSLGRSSIYNRLKLGGEPYFSRVGFTEGYGHFQVPQDLFEKMRHYLTSIGHPYAGGNEFGNGPNWRLRAIRACLEDLKIDSKILQHNLKREVFVCPLAQNYREYLRQEHRRPQWGGLTSVTEIAQLAKDRWIIPRSQRCDDWRAWESSEALSLIEGVFESKERLKNGSRL